MGRQVANECIERGIEEIESNELWAVLGITDRSSQTKIGVDFASRWWVS